MLTLTLQWIFAGQRYRVTASERGPLYIGRGPDCHVQQVGPSVSSRHAEIYYHQGCFYVRNLTLQRTDRPANPVAVNGAIIARSTPLQAGDRLQLGAILFEVVSVEDQKLGIRCPRCGRIIDPGREDCPWDGANLVNGVTSL